MHEDTRYYLITPAGTELTGVTPLKLAFPAHDEAVEALTEKFLPADLLDHLGRRATMAAFRFQDVTADTPGVAMYSLGRDTTTHRVFAFGAERFAFKVARNQSLHSLGGAVLHMSDLADRINPLNLITESGYVVRVPTSYLGVYLGNLEGEIYGVEVMERVMRYKKVPSLMPWSNSAEATDAAREAIISAVGDFVFSNLFLDFYDRNILLDETPHELDGVGEVRGTIYVVDQYLGFS